MRITEYPDFTIDVVLNHPDSSSEFTRITVELTDEERNQLQSCENNSYLYKILTDVYDTLNWSGYYHDAVFTFLTILGDEVVKTEYKVSSSSVTKINNTDSNSDLSSFRASMLKWMHQTIIDLGDEEAYDSWITYGVPDEPSDDDFDFISKDEEEYNETLYQFVWLLRNYAVIK